MKQAVVQQLAGVTGQVAAVLPLLIVTIYLSNVDGLEVAGQFTVLVGTSAAIYSTSLWGLRSLVQLDQFRSYAAEDLVGTRLIAALVATTAVIGAASLLQSAWLSAALVIFLRTADAIIDLRFAMTQVWMSTPSAIGQFAILHIIKLALVVTAISLSFLGLASFDISAVVASLASLILAVYGFARVLRRNGVNSIHFGRILDVLRAAFWFALAAGLCAVVTSAPRIVLPLMYAGDELGVMGIALSVSTFFGMTFNTTWIRHVTEFRSEFRNTASRFLFENLTVATLLAAASWIVLPPIVAFVFGFTRPEESVLTTWVLLSSVAFFAGMNSCNLYRVSRLPWMEAVTYVLTLIASALAFVAVPQLRSTPLLLLVAAAILLSSGLGAVFVGGRVESR